MLLLLFVINIIKAFVIICVARDCDAEDNDKAIVVTSVLYILIINWQIYCSPFLTILYSGLRNTGYCEVTGIRFISVFIVVTYQLHDKVEILL